jgi:SprT-like domain-contaning protein Spartan
MYNKYFKSADEHEIMDIYEMFNYYNGFFFADKLDKCYVEWSEKMTLCAGTCTHSSYDSCTIKLSAPLLQYRTANELKETLLHEMIHAFLFLTNPRACLTEGGHGKEFQEIMRNINSITSLNITIYHNFHDEVNLHRKHIWRCNGLCKTRPPFYGYVKRAMNRKPQPADRWFAEHQRVCGG